MHGINSIHQRIVWEIQKNGKYIQYKDRVQNKKYHRGLLWKMKPKMELRHKLQCIFRIPCRRGRECIAWTNGPLGVRIKEHEWNIKQGYFDRSKLAAHLCEEGHQIDWDQTGISQFGPISVYRKYKLAAWCR